jgi:hypothetical protein
MKTSLIIFVILYLTVTGCSTTTRFSLKDESSEYIKKQLYTVEKNENVGAEVTILLMNKSVLNGELLSVRDSTMTLCTEYFSTEEELSQNIFPIILIVNNEILELTVEGDSYVWIGIGAGVLVGAVAGALIGSTSDEMYAGLAGMTVGIIFGPIIGGIIGRSLSTETYELQDIPTGFDWSILKPLSRYPDKEPEYLKAIDS